MFKESIVKSHGSSFIRTYENDDNCRKTKTELKNVILDLFDHVREPNARNMEKDRMIATLTEKLDAVCENQRQQKLDPESWLAKEHRWNRERESLQKTIKDLNNIIKILKKNPIDH